MRGHCAFEGQEPLRRLAPAKVNLVLEVLGRRSDGYHDLATLMVPVTLYDELTFRTIPKGIVLNTSSADLTGDEANLVYRAAALLLNRLPSPPGVDIRLDKHIPIAAGLGGGSSDAATTLLAVNDLLGKPFSSNELMQMGSQLGADVAFFVQEKPAWGFGIGDQLTPLDGLPPLEMILINPGFDLSTSDVYRRLNFGLTNADFHYSIPQFSTVLGIAEGLHNDLEQVSLQLHPVIGELKDLLKKNGAISALMSGSGPTVFGIFEDEAGAIRAETEIVRQEAWRIFRVRSR